MSKKYQIAILCLLAIASSAVYLFTHPKSQSVNPTSQDGGTNATFTEDTDAYSVDLTYPMFNLSLRGAKEANAAIKANLDNQIASFTREAESSLKPPIDLPADVISTVTGSPTVEDETDRYVSLMFGAEWYLRGAAHPYHTINTYIFDKKLGKLVDITDLFKPDSNYLQFLSGYAYEDLIAQSEAGDLGLTADKQMLKSGTEGTYDNFHLALPTKDGLVIYFPEYQVGPYAAGSQQVTVPYEKIQSLIAPEGAISIYLK